MAESFSPEAKFKTPDDERSFLHSEVARLEKALAENGAEKSREEAISDTIHSYKAVPSENVLTKRMALGADKVRSLVENLAPEAHDDKVEALLGILNQKGLKNVIDVIEKMHDTHLEDDFHRFLVQYIKRGFPVKGAEERTPYSKLLHMTLYEVLLPGRKDDGDKQLALKALISGMEQFYAGMLGSDLVIEIANSNGSEEFVFYVAVPDDKRDLFEKQILSIFADARVTECVNDHNIFNTGGVSVASVAQATRNVIFPLKVYEHFDHDPLNVILNSFSKMDKDGEGACIQVLVNPAGDIYQKRYTHALERIQKGTPVKEAVNFSASIGAEVGKVFGELFSKPKDKQKEEDKKPVDPETITMIKAKTSKPIVNVSVRIVASASTEARAENILHEIESGFNQFDDPHGNSLTFKKIRESVLPSFLRAFAFRSWDKSEAIPLNLAELTTLMHFHTGALQGVSQLKSVHSSDAPAPLDLPQEGTVLGVNNYRGIESKIYITDEDRLRHFYTVGQTGTGKTNFLKTLIIQDIERGNGVCMIDPHGSDVQDVLRHIPEERMKDVIYFDPSYTERPMGLNMLEYDRSKPEQKTFVVNELFSIFQKLYGGVPESMGPMFEQYFRNATMLVIEDPDSGSTLLDVSRVMSNKEFRQMKLSRCKNPIVVQFWTEIAEKAGGEGALANIVPYITSKFDVFLANDIMRPIVAQEHSSFDFRDIMDNKKILLVNLAKGRLGDINANLIGLILVGKILMAALSRVDMLGKDFPAFYLYIDEFQNITTPSISTILSEARKYRLSLFIAHQFIAQLTDDIKNAVFGNVGSMAAFRVGSDDAEYLEKQFSPVFTAKDIMNIDNYNCFIRMLAHGKPVKPFNIKTLAVPAGGNENIERLKQMSYEKFGRNREEVDAEILEKYKKAKPVGVPL